MAVTTRSSPRSSSETLSIYVELTGFNAVLEPQREQFACTQIRERETADESFKLHSENPPAFAEIPMATGRVGHFLRIMEEEIIRTGIILLGDHSYPARYTATSQEAIQADNPPPDGPVMNLPAN